MGEQEESLLPQSERAQNGDATGASEHRTVRARVHDMVEGKLDTWFEYALLFVIFFNVLSLVVSTVETGRSDGCIGSDCERLGDRYNVVFESIEWVSVAIFTLEYIMRLWAAAEDPGHAQQGPVWGRVRYALGFYAIIDVLAILPNWISFATLVTEPLTPGTTYIESPNFTTAGRIFRLVRIFKTDKYLNAFGLLGDVLWDNRVLLVATSFYSMMVWVISSTLLYYTERDNHAESMGNHFQSIPLSMFPTLLMLTGEYPLADFSPIGQVIAGVVAVVAVAIFAVPTSILGSGFMKAVQQSQGRQLTFDCD